MLEELVGGYLVLHLRTLAGNDRAEIEELAQRLAVVFSSPARFGLHLGGFGNDAQGAVGCEIEHIAVLFALPVDSSGCLHTEDGLHITACRGVECAGQHHHRCPFGYAHARGQFAAREGDGVVAVANGFLYEFEGIAFFGIVIALACHVHYLEVAEYRVRLQQRRQGFGGLYPWQHPQGMVETLAERLIREWEEAFFVRFGEQVKKSTHVLFVDESAVLAGAEELGKVERHVHIHILRHQSAEVESVDVHCRQPRVRVRVSEMRLVPSGFGTLLHHIVPRVYLVLFVLAEEVERRT